MAGSIVEDYRDDKPVERQEAEPTRQLSTRSLIIYSESERTLRIYKDDAMAGFFLVGLGLPFDAKRFHDWLMEP